MVKIISALLLFNLFSTYMITSLHCQVPPCLDNNWILKQSKSDEFNGTTLDNSKWDALNPSNGIGYNWGGGAYFRPASTNVDVTVNIKADELKTGIYIYSLTADQKTIDTKTFIITE